MDCATQVMDCARLCALGGYRDAAPIPASPSFCPPNSMVTDGRKPQPRANGLQRGLTAKDQPVTKGFWTLQSQWDAWMIPLSLFSTNSLLGNNLKIPHCPAPNPDKPPPVPQTHQAKVIYIVGKLVSKKETARLSVSLAPGQLLRCGGAADNHS